MDAVETCDDVFGVLGVLEEATSESGAATSLRTLTAARGSEELPPGMRTTTPVPETARTVPTTARMVFRFISVCHCFGVEVGGLPHAADRTGAHCGWPGRDDPDHVE
ncbi:hypothetical protein AB0H12_30405 [Actinosynnema sp. NPDC023794]